jgi:hypothetical protein
LAITAANGINQKDGDDAPRQNSGHSHSKNVLYRIIRAEAKIKTVKYIFEAFPFKNESSLPICRSEYTTAKVKGRRNGVSYYCCFIDAAVEFTTE